MMNFARKIEDFEYRNPYHICLVVDHREDNETVGVRYSPFPEFHGEVWKGDDCIHAILKGVSSIIGCSTTTMTIKTVDCDDIGYTVAVIGGDAVTKWMEPEHKPVEDRIYHADPPKSGDEFMLVKVEKVGEVVWKVTECNDIPGCVGSELTNAFQQNAVLEMVRCALGCPSDELKVRLLNSNWEKGLHDVQVWGDPVTAFLSVVPRSGDTAGITKEEVADAAARIKEEREAGYDTSVYTCASPEEFKRDQDRLIKAPLVKDDPDRVQTTMLPPKALLGTQWAHKAKEDPTDVPAVAPPWKGPSKDYKEDNPTFVSEAERRRYEKSKEVRVKKVPRYPDKDKEILDETKDYWHPKTGTWKRTPPDEPEYDRPKLPPELPPKATREALSWEPVKSKEDTVRDAGGTQEQIEQAMMDDRRVADERATAVREAEKAQKEFMKEHPVDNPPSKLYGNDGKVIAADDVYGNEGERGPKDDVKTDLDRIAEEVYSETVPLSDIKAAMEQMIDPGLAWSPMPEEVEEAIEEQPDYPTIESLLNGILQELKDLNAFVRKTEERETS